MTLMRESYKDFGPTPAADRHDRSRQRLLAAVHGTLQRTVSMVPARPENLHRALNVEPDRPQEILC